MQKNLTRELFAGYINDIFYVMVDAQVIGLVLQNVDLLSIRNHLSVSHTAYFTRSSWKYFLTRSGEGKEGWMCKIIQQDPSLKQVATANIGGFAGESFYGI